MATQTVGDRMVEAQPEGLLTIRFDGGATHWRLSLGGELDLATAPMLERALQVCEAQDDRPITIDLRELTFMDVAGLRVLLAANERRRSGLARLTLVRGPRAVDRVIELTGSRAQFCFRPP